MIFKLNNMMFTSYVITKQANHSLDLFIFFGFQLTWVDAHHFLD